MLIAPREENPRDSTTEFPFRPERVPASGREGSEVLGYFTAHARSLPRLVSASG